MNLFCKIGFHKWQEKGQYPFCSINICKKCNTGLIDYGYAEILIEPKEVEKIIIKG